MPQQSADSERGRLWHQPTERIRNRIMMGTVMAKPNEKRMRSMRKSKDCCVLFPSWVGGSMHPCMHACMYPCGDGCIHQPLLLVSDGEKRSHQTMTTKTTKTHTRTHTWLAGNSVSRIFVRRSMKGVLWMKFSFFAVVLKQFVPRVLSALSGGRSSLSSDFQHCGSFGPLRNRCCVGDVRRICL